MTAFLVPLGAALLIVAVSTVVPARRDRRRRAASEDSLRIEEAATRGVREARRRAHAYRDAFLCERE
ncbi:hypothetical protein GCM10018980_31510 [Streptomyces capoamus]|uniref:Uncharacterized protein n=1 Tax=Streptomyces capoamus TaxID=68183 RepID=A0A919C4Z7_9ACTN|nr:hypothetical protein [Streptomyces capoamus]GGW17844.1 hypothetical protein GCM10010501_40080 [Streptomyces libani subsp. rufus]GHG49984.1 hypothetical protein GCM10018980_31510 [Streptomyces capoamus]